MRRIKLFFASLAVLLCLVPAAPALAFDPFEKACNATTQNSPACQATGQDPLTGKNGMLYKVSRIIALIAGICAVFMIMFGGFTYITANGESAKAKNGKSMIVGAVVGLVVVMLAEAIITFTINLIGN